MAPAHDLDLPSFAKVNWYLKIEGRRPDGYHQITTVFQTIDLSDRILFSLTDQPGIMLRVKGRDVPGGEENLVHRAAVSVSEKLRPRRGLSIVLEKRIPAGGGLGGGSSNAAVTLLAANELWGGGLHAAELQALARGLGADVPFFLCGGSALGTGRGDELSGLPDCGPELDLVLVFPGFPTPTREAYQARDWGRYQETPVLTSDSTDNKMQRFCKAMKLGFQDFSWLQNDFEQVIFERYPALGRVRQALTAAGCERVLLCGSGSTLLGIVTRDKAEGIAQEVARKTGGEILLSRSLPRQEYKDIFKQAGLDLKHCERIEYEDLLG